MAAAATREAGTALAEGVAISGDALERILTETHCYPYFLQEWGKHAWDAADTSPIDLRDVERATRAATADAGCRVPVAHFLESSRSGS